MNTSSRPRSSLGWIAAATGVAAGAYAAYVATTWCRYGRSSCEHKRHQTDPLLDRFIPVYEVRERHQIHVAAAAADTLAAAREMDLLHSPAVRAIVKAREWILGAVPESRPRPRGLLAETQALGWGVLADVPDREIVVGAVTQPWNANVVFRALPPDAFAAFDEPEFVKIVWTLRADPISADGSLFSTETRVVATDAVARSRFRWYWSVFSPGIFIIRWLSLRPLKADAERRARGIDAGRPSPSPAESRP